MSRFRDGELDVLVGTTVIEVGVDVPAATMMVIEGADRFGLAQLHQLRGRVGRGTVESFCVLVSDSTDEVAQARLKAVAEMHDGFELAERTSSCDARATSWAWPRAACRGSGSRRCRTRPIASWRSGRGRTRSGCSTPGGRSRRRDRPWRPSSSRLAPPGRRSRAGERRVTGMRPAASLADAGRVIAGPARGIRLDAPGAGTRPLGDRVKQTPVRDPRAGPARRARPGPVRRQWGRRDRGAVARRRARDVRRARPGGDARDRREPGADAPGRAARRRDRRRAALAAPARDGVGRPFDVVFVDPPYAESDLLVAALEALGAGPRRRAPGSSPSTSGATGCRRRSGC